MIKAIETRYAGCRFRSRLEARWAVFMDAIGIEWQYEPEGFELPSGPYLPDFYLPKHVTCGITKPGIWLEIKGKPYSFTEGRLAWELQQESGHAVFIADGDIPRDQTCSCSWHPKPTPFAAAAGVKPGTGLRPALMMWIERPDSEFVHRTDRICLFHGDGIPKALEAARSARFEHGERG